MPAPLSLGCTLRDSCRSLLARQDGGAELVVALDDLLLVRAQELVVPDFALGVLQAVRDERKEYRRAVTGRDDFVKGARARISALSARVEQLEEERESNRREQVQNNIADAVLTGLAFLAKTL